MSIGVLHGQNGGTVLAVKVVGGTQKPSNAKQGVIWVNTDQKITGWTMQVEEPTEPTEGMVWIAILTPARLNALKKNGIWFTPTSAKQYSDGGWVKKTGEYYNNDQWVALFEATIHITYPAGSVCTATDGTTTLKAPDTSGTWDCVVTNAGIWTISLSNGMIETIDVTESNGVYYVSKWHLYDRGDEKTAITGGWTLQTGTGMAVSKSDSSIDYAVTGSSARWANIYAANKIDLTGVNTIIANVDIASIDSTLYLIVSSAMPDDTSYSKVSAAGVTAAGVHDVSLDVSALSGSYYICVQPNRATGKLSSVLIDYGVAQ